MFAVIVRVFFAVALFPVSNGEKDKFDLDEVTIRELLTATDGTDRTKLAELGGYTAAAFPLYVRILDDPKENTYLVQKVLWVLSDPQVKADRSRFLDRAVAKLSHPRTGVRRTALELLAQIGSSRDAAPVVALLSDKEWMNSLTAAKTLVAIGDDRTLAAMDVWINSSSPHGDRNARFDEAHRQDIAKYRDELKRRLENAKASKKGP